jgi:hypothetical protein
MKARAHRIAAGAVLAFAAAGGLQGGSASTAPTRDAYDAERRRVAALESELALASTRKPYLVLDLQEKELRYRLLGMTLREVPLPGLSVKGLVAAGHGTKLDAPALAGIFTVREKDGDPRLKPLTPEQVEAGADDENVANVLPPEPPKSYRVKFVQPVVVRIAGQESGGKFREGWAGLRGLWDRLRGAGGEDDTRLELFVQVDAKTGDEIYRSLIPDLRWLVLAPRGYILPSAGQEAPPKPKPPRAAPKPPPKPIEPPGVPFQIPTPMDEAGTGGPAEPTAQPETPPEAQPPAEPPPDEPPPPPPPPDDPDPGRP